MLNRLAAPLSDAGGGGDGLRAGTAPSMRHPSRFCWRHRARCRTTRAFRCSSTARRWPAAARRRPRRWRRSSRGTAGRRQWRDGIYPFHHYHTLRARGAGLRRTGRRGCCSAGRAGGEVVFAAGDVAVLPAGTGHCRLSDDAGLLVVGAYPPGQRADICREAADAGDAGADRGACRRRRRTRSGIRRASRRSGATARRPGIINLLSTARLYRSGCGHAPGPER